MFCCFDYQRYPLFVFFMQSCRITAKKASRFDVKTSNNRQNFKTLQRIELSYHSNRLKEDEKGPLKWFTLAMSPTQY